jgi:uncharacterized protein HemX
MTLLSSFFAAVPNDSPPIAVGLAVIGILGAIIPAFWTFRSNKQNADDAAEDRIIRGFDSLSEQMHSELERLAADATRMRADRDAAVARAADLQRQRDEDFATVHAIRDEIAKERRQRWVVEHERDDLRTLVDHLMKQLGGDSGAPPRRG